MEHIKDFLENGNFLVNLGKPAPPVNQTFHCTPFVLVKVIVFQQKSFKIKHKQLYTDGVFIKKKELK